MEIPWEKVRAIAQNVRNWAEDRDWHSIKTLYGFCAKASARLHTLLVKEGIPAKIGCNDHHVYVIVDNYIVDVTATQFGPWETVTVLPLEEAGKYKHWEAQQIKHSAKELVGYQRRMGWPSDQLAEY